MVRLYPDSPARATSVTQTGARLAGIAGPIVFGMVVATTTYTIGWLIAGGACLGSGVVILVGRAMHRRCASGGALPACTPRE